MLLNLNLKKQIIASNGIFWSVVLCFENKEKLIVIGAEKGNIIKGVWWRNVICDVKKIYNVFSLNVLWWCHSTGPRQERQMMWIVLQYCSTDGIVTEILRISTTEWLRKKTPNNPVFLCLENVIWVGSNCCLFSMLQVWLQLSAESEAGSAWFASHITGVFLLQGFHSFLVSEVFCA